MEEVKIVLKSDYELVHSTGAGLGEGQSHFHSNEAITHLERINWPSLVM
jgi:hypothetical protein